MTTDRAPALTNLQCDAIRTEVHSRLDYKQLGGMVEARALIRAAYAAGAASVPRVPRQCSECGTYENSHAYCHTCGFAWKDAAREGK